VRAAEARSGRKVVVAFNLRYTPTHKRLKQMILAGDLGRITNVELVYNLDEWHGSSYFYRWNRERAKSGGLCVHKCCHHFDLVNWLLGDSPQTLFAFGALNYYGADGALRPRDGEGRPLSRAEEKRNCPIFQKHYASKADPEGVSVSPGWDSYNLPFDVQYPPDRPRYIYDEAIDVEDTYSAVVRYRGGASLSYSCNFCTPWEGYALGINGTKGRAEVTCRMDPNPTGKSDPLLDGSTIVHLPLFGERRAVAVPAVAGGHGGADFAIQSDLFGHVSEESRSLGLVAGSAEGAKSVAMGEAVWRSIASGRPVDLPRLMDGETAQ
jgi:predicted dehydrogenase